MQIDGGVGTRRPVLKYPGRSTCCPAFDSSELRRAMAAALRGDRNRHRAPRAIFGGWYRRWRGFFRKAIHLLDHQENHERYYQKIDHIIDEDPVVKRLPRWLRRLGRRKRITMSAAQIDEQSCKIDLANQLADGRHKHILDQRRHNLSKRSANDQPDRQIHDIAAHCEFLKLFQHRRSPLLFDEDTRRPEQISQMEGLSVPRIIVEAQNKETEQRPSVGISLSAKAEGTLLGWPEDQIGSYQAAQHEQSTAGSQHRTDPGDGHAGNRKHHNAQKHELQPARPALPAPPPLARTKEP